MLPDLFEDLDDAVQRLSSGGQPDTSGHWEWKTVLVKTVDDMLGPEVYQLILMLKDAQDKKVADFLPVFDLHTRVVSYLSNVEQSLPSLDSFLSKYGSIAMKLELQNEQLTDSDTTAMTKLVEGKDPQFNPRSYSIAYNDWKRAQLQEGLKGYIRFK